MRGPGTRRGHSSGTEFDRWADSPRGNRAARIDLPAVLQKKNHGWFWRRKLINRSMPGAPSASASGTEGGAYIAAACRNLHAGSHHGSGIWRFELVTGRTFDGRAHPIAGKLSQAKLMVDSQYKRNPWRSHVLHDVAPGIAPARWPARVWRGRHHGRLRCWSRCTLGDRCAHWALRGFTVGWNRHECANQ